MTCHADTSVVWAISFQYDHSVHAAGETTNRNNPPCATCHTNEGFVESQTGEPFFDEHLAADRDLENPSPIGCFTCHAPHTNGDFSLRADGPVDLIMGGTFDYGPANICGNCHQARAANPAIDPAGITVTSSRWGPHHGTQGNMLAGEGGYEMEGYEYTNSIHTYYVDNGCVACHMAAPEGGVAGGHSWNMTYEDEGEEAEFTTGCNVEGCHQGDLEDFNYEGAQDEIQTLLDQLETVLMTSGIMNEEHLLVASQSSPLELSEAQAAAVWNFLLVWEDRSLGVHNTEYAAALLQNSLDALSK